MRLGVIGTGYWGSNHARVASQLQDEGVISNVVFCDKDSNRVKTIASDYSADYVVDYRNLTSKVDAAVIATPSQTHLDIAKELLTSGVDCLVEKPLAMSSDAAWEITETAEREGQTLAVGHIFRHHPALEELKQCIKRGELGEIKHLHTNRYSFRVPRKTSGVLHQLAVHDIDIYRYLLDKHPEQIYCKTESWVREEIEETATLTLNYDEVMGTINESWQVPVFGKQRDLVVVGTERAAYLDYLEDTRFELYDSRIKKSGSGLHAIDEGVTTYETENREPLRVEVVDFLQACHTESRPKASGTVGAEAIELIEIAQRSNKENEVQTVSL